MWVGGAGCCEMPQAAASARLVADAVLGLPLAMAAPPMLRHCVGVTHGVTRGVERRDWI